jgi:hypothetical protein
MDDAPMTWQRAALLIGEQLASVGPQGYYEMTAAEWRDWALSVITHGPLWAGRNGLG